jgi:hypothetical protein
MTSFFDSLNMIVRASSASPPVAIVVRRWVNWVGGCDHLAFARDLSLHLKLRARAGCEPDARVQGAPFTRDDRLPSPAATIDTERAAYCSFALSRRWIFERNKNQFPPAIRSKALRGQCLRMVKEAKGQRPVGKSQSATCAKFQAVACIAADGVIGSRTARTAARSGAAVVPRPAHSSGEEEGRS